MQYTTGENGTIIVKDRYFEKYISSEAILSEVEAMANKMFEEHGDANPLFLSVLNGSFMFTSDLLKFYPGVCELSFIKVSSYHGTRTTGEVITAIGLTHDIKDRTVILLEDIIDSGITVYHLTRDLEKLRPRALKVATLLLKPEALQKDIKAHYIGFEIPRNFIVGYGLDYDGLGRNLQDIYKIKE